LLLINRKRVRTILVLAFFILINLKIVKKTTPFLLMPFENLPDFHNLQDF